jgi:hypothetical protein
MKFQQGAIEVAEADFAAKSSDFGMVGENVGGGGSVAVELQPWVPRTLLFSLNNNEQSEFGPIMFQQGAIGVAEADFAGNREILVWLVKM